MKKTKLKKTVIDIIIGIIIFVCVFNIVVSIYHIVLWKNEGNEIEKELDEIEEITAPVEVVEDDNKDRIEIIKQQEEPDELNPYWAYVNMNLISVDFSDLKEVNSDTVGWIQVNGTNINYPFVQTDNNEYYLKHSFNKKNNSAGWVFLDYRNSNELTDKNNILYAHGRIDNTMFGTLRKALTNGWLDDKNNFVIKISTPKENTLWQVFSAYKIPATSDYIQVKFNSDDKFLEFGNMLIKRSAYNFNTSISKDDKILTLSTCYDNKERMVVHAKLIKRETR